MNSVTKPIVSIGLPVYNGEKFIRKALDSLLSQSFTNFELIISDNASTDSTKSICEEYARKDPRIRYIRQIENMGPLWNYRFVLKEAKCDYFHWAPADDLWHPNFLEKNIKILESRDNVVGSIGNVMFFDKQDDDLNTLINYTENSLKEFQVLPAYGSYNKKVRIYLKLRKASVLYAVYRTEKIRKCVNHKESIVWDFALVLHVLKYGDLHVIDDVLMYRYAGGISGTKSNLEYMLEHNFSIFVILFPNLPFTIWCTKQLGMRTFTNNFFWIMRYFLQGESQLLLDLINLCKKRLRTRI